MQYQEYLNSARKHQFTCTEIKSSLDRIDIRNCTGKTKQKQLLFNLYYLSGYIIECSIKYAIFHLISYDRNSCVRKLDQDGLSFDRHIKHHRFERYADELRIRQSGIILIDDITNIDKDVIFIYRCWDAEVRYWFNDIDESIKSKLTARNVNSLFDLATKLMTHVQSM